MFTIFFFSALPSREQHSLKWKRASYKWSTEIPFIIKQLLLQLFDPFIRQVSLLQCLIVILWPDLKIERFQFLCLVFLNTAARVGFFPDEIIYIVAEVFCQHNQNQGVMDPALSAPHRKNYLHPTQRGEIWGWGQAREDPQAGVFSPVWKESCKNPCSWAASIFHQFLVTTGCGQGRQEQPPGGTEPSHSGWATPFIRERKGISVKHRFQIAHDKILCHF